MRKIPVWIDCDTGVDDAAAILTAGQLESIEIVGISAVAGNVPLEKTTKNCICVSDLMGRNYPVYAGASRPWIRPYEDASSVHGNSGLGGAVLPPPSKAPEKEKAWEAIYREAVKRSGELELVATGPLTNVANALTLYPDLKHHLKRILIMGGAASGGNVTPCAEYNILTDPDAAQAVFRSGVKVYMFGLDVTEKAYVTREELEEINRYGSPVTTFFHDSIEPRISWYEGLGFPGSCLHDVCPLLYLEHPEIFRTEEAGVFVETQSELTLGKTVTDLFSDHQFEEKNAVVALDLDRPAFIRYMFEALKKY